MFDILKIVIPIIIILAVAGFYAFWIFSRRRGNDTAEQNKNESPKPLPKSAPITPYMDSMLLNFYRALKQALPDKYIIYVHVPIEKLFDASRRNELNMKGQYADMVVFTPELMPLLVIDLFDMSIINLDRVNKIKTVSKGILRNSGIPVLDYRCNDSYNIDELRRLIANLLNPLRVDSK